MLRRNKYNSVSRLIRIARYLNARQWRSYSEERAGAIDELIHAIEILLAA